tara:strand:- start:479 stop:628 length:150 start_codon:yes stop_codon:yes gene_type:complete
MILPPPTNLPLISAATNPLGSVFQNISASYFPGFHPSLAAQVTRYQIQI